MLEIEETIQFTRYAEGTKHTECEGKENLSTLSGRQKLIYHIQIDRIDAIYVLLSISPRLLDNICTFLSTTFRYKPDLNYT